jgi:hypothetical protein
MQESPDSGRPAGRQDVLDRLAMHAVERLTALLVNDADEMDDGLAPFAGGGERGRLEDVSRQGFHRAVVPVPGGIRIARQDGDGMPAPQERVHEMRAYKPGASGNKDLQFSLLQRGIF